MTAVAQVTGHPQLDGTVVYEASDGSTFEDPARAEVHQQALAGTLADTGFLVNAVPAVPMVGTLQVTHLHGEALVDGDVPDGDAMLVQDFKTMTYMWRMSPATREALQSEPPTKRVAIVRQLTMKREGGETVATGVVKMNVRRGQQTREPRVDLQPLIDKAKALVVTIAELDQLSDGQVVEITKTVSTLQAEFDRLMEQMAELDSHLSIGRAVILAHSLGA